MSLQSPEAVAPEMRSCPHLGVREDPHTCLGYPAAWNLCYRARPVAAVSLEHQRTACLSPVFMRCAVFQRDRRGPLPGQLRGARMATPWKWALLAALVFLIALGLWAALGAWGFPASGGLGQEAALAAAFPAPAWPQPFLIPPGGPLQCIPPAPAGSQPMG